MYAAFPYECLDGVKAYVVDEIDEDEGTIHLAEIKSGLVPSKTPVILACNSTTASENRLLPLVEEPEAVSTTNLLKGEIWLKDYTKDESAYRTKFDGETMRVLSNNEPAFVNENNEDILAGGTTTGTLTYIANNTCYLETTSPIEKFTLDATPKAAPVVGYFRVKNAGANAQDKRTVYVTSESTANPNATTEEAKTLPGAVLYINAPRYAANPSELVVENLRSQGVDASAAVYGNITTNLKDGFRSALTVLNSLYSWGFDDAKQEELNAAMFEKMQMFMEPTTTSDGKDAYYLKSSTPTIQPVLDALTQEQIANLALTGDVEQAFWNLMWDKAMESFEEQGQTQIKEEFEFYKNRINMGQTYYLITGRVDPNWNAGTQTFVYNENAPQVGFANNNPYEDSETLKPEIEVAGDYAKWIVTPVTQEDNYFAVAPSDKMQGNDGHYYTSLFVDFPFETVGTDMRVWGIEGEPVVTEYADGSKVAVVTTKEYTGVVPTQTPVIVECVSTDVAENILQPVSDPFGTTGTSFIRGMFFDRSFDQHGGSYTDDDVFTFGDTEVKRKQFRAFSKNTADENNPLGFYKYSGTLVKGNRAFMVLSESMANAKVLMMAAPEEETNGIGNVPENSVTDLRQTAVYDLQGRRVSHPTKGLYIVNGKKMVIK